MFRHSKRVLQRVVRAEEKKAHVFGQNQLTVRMASPSGAVLKDFPAKMVVIPTFAGPRGILRDHPSVVAELQPGQVKVFPNDINVVGERFFVSGGFATMSMYDSVLSITCAEVCNVNDLDGAAATAALDEAKAAVERAPKESKEEAEAKIQAFTLERIVTATSDSK